MEFIGTIDLKLCGCILVTQFTIYDVFNSVKASSRECHLLIFSEWMCYHDDALIEWNIVMNLYYLLWIVFKYIHSLRNSLWYLHHTYPNESSFNVWESSNCLRKLLIHSNFLFLFAPYYAINILKLFALYVHNEIPVRQFIGKMYIPFLTLWDVILVNVSQKTA